MYVKNIIKKFRLEKVCVKHTPSLTHVKMSKDSEGTKIYESLYRRMIGSFLYLTASRPDKAFSTSVCAKYQSCPKSSHFLRAKRIIKNISCTYDYGLLYIYFFDTNSSLVGYCDAD